MLVDDEPLIRLIAADALEEAGFAVLEGASADHALELLRTREDVGLLFTDINMPGSLDGLALAEVVHARWPAIKIVLTSGRPLLGPIPDDGIFLQKPYAMHQMTAAIASLSGQG